MIVIYYLNSKVYHIPGIRTSNFITRRMMRMMRLMLDRNVVVTKTANQSRKRQRYEPHNSITANGMQDS